MPFAGPSLRFCFRFGISLMTSCWPIHWAGAATGVSYWKFDELGGATAHDSSGMIDGQLSPTGARFVTGGISGNALALERFANGFVTLGDVFNFSGQDFSIVAWIKLTPGDPAHDIIVAGKQAAGSTNGYFIGVNESGNGGQPNKASFYAGLGAQQDAVSSTSVNDGRWHQIVAVYEARGNKSIYVDGSPAEDSRIADPFVTAPVPFMIGGLTYGGIPRGLFTGLIDEVQVYRRALQPDEIDFLFQHPTLVLSPATTGLAVEVIGLAVMDRQTGLFEQMLRVRNLTLAPVGATRVFVRNLAAGTELYNSSGILDGIPYVQSDAALGPGEESREFVLEFYRRDRASFPEPLYTAEPVIPSDSFTPAGVLLEIDRKITVGNLRTLIEFSAIPGRSYAVQYSSDLQNWTTVRSTITATANRVQWFDDGPPKTDFKPALGTRRFYRIILLPQL